MTTKRRVLLVLLGIAGAAFLWYLLYRSDQAYIPPEEATSAAQPAAPPAPGGAPSPGALAAAAASVPPVANSTTAALIHPNSAPTAADLPAVAATPSSGGSLEPVLPPQIATEAVRSAIQKFGSTFGGNPVGTNAEITAALQGDNPTHSNFLSGLPGTKINSNGELLDPWGTPYFFHQISGRDMEVHSAGPDRTMWDSDDVILK